MRERERERKERERERYYTIYFIGMVEQERVRIGIKKHIHF